MRIKILFATVLALSLMLATALAGDITGTWKGTMDMMGQSMELGFKFKADGAKLGGTAIGPEGEESPITEGKIDGDKITFTVKVEGQMSMTFKYKGTIAADAIKLTMSMDMGGGMGGPGGGGMGGPGGGEPGGGMPPMEITLKKVE